MHEELQQKKRCIEALERQAHIQVLGPKMAKAHDQLIQIFYHKKLFCQHFTKNSFKAEAKKLVH